MGILFWRSLLTMLKGRLWRRDPLSTTMVSNTSCVSKLDPKVIRKGRSNVWTKCCHTRPKWGAEGYSGAIVCHDVQVLYLLATHWVEEVEAEILSLLREKLQHCPWNLSLEILGGLQNDKWWTCTSIDSRNLLLQYVLFCTQDTRRGKHTVFQCFVFTISGKGVMKSVSRDQTDDWLLSADCSYRVEAFDCGSSDVWNTILNEVWFSVRKFCATIVWSHAHDCCLHTHKLGGNVGWRGGWHGH